MSIKFDKSVFLQQFKEESKEHLYNLSQALLKLEMEPANREIIDEVFREAHTLKGSATMMGFNSIRDVSHAMEDVFDRVRSGEMYLSSAIIDKLLKAVDIIENLVEIETKGEKVGINIEKVIEDISFASQDTKKEIEIQSKQKITSVKEKIEHEETIRIKTQKLNYLLNLAGELLISKNYIEQRVKKLNKIKASFDKLRESIAKIQDDSSSVENEELKHLYENIQELNLFSEKLKEDFSDFKEEIEFATSRIGVRTYELQDAVMRIRMLPISTLFAVFPRLVRDLSREVGKDIHLDISGEETELDKQVIEEISESLVQLVRNAIDHGIEDPEERVKLRKPKTGRIKLEAKSRGSEVEICVSDDGRGIDIANIKDKALSLGIIRESDLDDKTDRELTNLIFSSGFSTKDKPTTLSGRGVGLDVVKEKVEKLKGMIEVTSQIGIGTKFIIRLPLTLSLTDALLVKAGSRTFAIPLSAIQEIVRASILEKIDEKDEKAKEFVVTKVETKEVIIVRKKLIPLIRLREVLNIDDGGEKEQEKFPVVIIGTELQQVALMVDELVGKQEIVAKPISDFISKVENIAGSTILGSGEVVLILDVPSIINNARKVSRQEQKRTISSPQKEIPNILVVEDSLTARELERSILENEGYRVDTAVDGLEAFEKIRKQKYDLIVTDIQMPRMDGFELTQRLRSIQEYKYLPIIIVTTKSSQEDIKRGIEVGADAYIVKSTFNQQELISCVERLIK